MSTGLQTKPSVREKTNIEHRVSTKNPHDAHMGISQSRDTGKRRCLQCSRIPQNVMILRALAFNNRFFLNEFSLNLRILHFFPQEVLVSQRIEQPLPSRDVLLRSFRRKLPVPLSFEAWPCSCLRFQQLWCCSHSVAVVRLHRHRRQHGWTCPQLARIVVFPFSRLGSCHFCNSVGRVLPVLLFIAPSRTTVASSVCSELPVCVHFGD